MASSTFALAAATQDREGARLKVKTDLERMSAAMVQEKGLLNHAQAGLMLGVSTKRVGELVRLGKLTDFEFLGRKYVSMRELRDRNKQEIKAGRPVRGKGERIMASLKAALKTDRNQCRLGGYAGQYEKHLEQERKRKQREKNKAAWRAIRKVLRS
jgi:hypothetical protein